MSQNNNQKDANAHGKLTYKLAVVKNASLGKLNAVLNEIHRRTGKNRIAILADILKCMKKFNAGYHDYQIFQWYKYEDWQRDTYLTRFRSKAFNMHVNDQSYSHCFDNKIEFNNIFKDYIGREFIDVESASKEDIIDYFNRKDKIFCKMINLACGHGAELIYTKDFADGEAFYNYVKDKGFGSLEDVIENHPDLAEMYPHSVNCMRMITIIDDNGDPQLAFCVQKFGNAGRIVDNYGFHGPVDLETGEFLYPAHPGETLAEEVYEYHPYTNKKFVGFKTPMFKEAKEMVLKAAMVVPQIRYVGWDVAITPTGPAIIEGNDYCAHDFWQLPGQTPNGIGAMPLLESLVPSFKCRAMAGKQEYLIEESGNKAYFRYKK